MVGLSMLLGALLEVMLWRNTNLKVNRLLCPFNLVWPHAMRSGSVIILLKQLYFNFCSIFMQTESCSWKCLLRVKVSRCRVQPLWVGLMWRNQHKMFKYLGKKILKHTNIEQMSKWVKGDRIDYINLNSAFLSPLPLLPLLLTDTKYTNGFSNFNWHSIFFYVRDIHTKDIL